MKKFALSLVCYVLGLSSLAAFFWLIQFGMHDNLFPFSWASVVQNSLIFLLFPLQHSILARPGFKQWIQTLADPLLERSIYVGTSGLAMWLVLWGWKPLGPALYKRESWIIFDLVFYAALTLLILSTVALDHGAMFGIKQGYAAWKGKEWPQSGLRTDGIYGIVRHPITSLFIVALWSHRTLTGGRLLFNLLFTAYALIGTIFEERDLVRSLGSQYQKYRERVPAFIPRLHKPT